MGSNQNCFENTDVIGEDMALVIRRKGKNKYSKGPYCLSCEGLGVITVFNVCDCCDGEGCSACHKGLVRASIPCQDPKCKAKEPAGRAQGTRPKKGRF